MSLFSNRKEIASGGSIKVTNWKNIFLALLFVIAIIGVFT